AHHVPPLDAYMMGLIDGDGVPPLYAYSPASPPPVLRCGDQIDDIVRTVTIDDIQAVHGRRTPGPEGAQRSFALAFLAESHDRLLSATELTFYELLAAHYTRAVDAGAPDPYLGPTGWAPMTRFFGAGTTWRSDVRVCGNGVRDVAEECDDGNTRDGDGCSARCTREISDLPRGITAVMLDAVNPRSRSPVAVGILTTPDFAATTVDASSVRFGARGAAPTAADPLDVDGDGDTDLRLGFRTRATGIGCGDTSAEVTGRTVDGRRFVGTVVLRLRGC